jgi:hypothetical protein
MQQKNYFKIYPPIIPADYPLLSLICWDIHPERPISERRALMLYRHRWEYICDYPFEPDEWQLFRRLVLRYLGGIFTPIDTLGQGGDKRPDWISRQMQVENDERVDWFLVEHKPNRP